MNVRTNLGPDSHTERITAATDAFLLELEEGREPSIARYLAEYPDLAAELPQILAAVRVMAESGCRSAVGDKVEIVHAAPPVVGTIGDYRVIREVGRGGMGVVYEAQQISLGRRVALKVLPFTAVLDERQIRRFKNEAQAAAQLHHENIVPVYAVGCDRGTHYYAMQYVEGRTLAGLIAELREATGPTAIDPFESTLQGRSAMLRSPAMSPVELREAGWPNRQAAPPGGDALGSHDAPTDLPTPKVQAAPRNVARPTTADFAGARSSFDRSRRESARPDADAQSPAAAARASCARKKPATPALPAVLSTREFFERVARMGLQAAEALDHAHELGIVHRDIKPSNLLVDGDGKIWVTDFGLARYQTDLHLTMTGELVGTFLYMSPEQALGRRGIDHRSDIYSLGVTLRELLTLEPAFRSLGSDELMRQLAGEDPPRPRAINPAIPVDLETILLKAMAKEPHERYETAREMADDLKRFLDNRPIRARRPTLLEQAVRWGRRHGRWVVAGGVVLLFAVIGLAASTMLVYREQQLTAAALQDAKQEFARAEAHFTQARQIVDRLCRQFPERLVNVPGAEPLRREFLSEALRYYQQFITQAQHDPKLRAELAASYFRVGTLTQHMGDADEALEAYEAARDIWIGLVGENPQVASYRRDLALCHNDLGLLHSQTKRHALADSSFQAGVALLSALARESPRVLGYQSDLALCYNNQGLLFSQTRRADEARLAYRKAIDLQRAVVATEANNLEHQSNLALMYNNLATLLREGNPTEAETAYRLAIELQSRIAQSDAKSLGVCADLAVTYSNFGALQSRLQRFDRATEAYMKAIQLQQELIRRAPTSAKFKNDLAVSLNNLGYLHSQAGATLEAVLAFRQAQPILAQLAEEYPHLHTYHSSLGGTLNNLGMALEKLGRSAEAKTAYEQAVTHQVRAFEAAPQVARYREFLSTHYVNLGRLQRQLGEPLAAAQSAEARHRLWKGDAERVYSVACELALAAMIATGARESPSAATDSSPPPTSASEHELQAIADLAIRVLRESYASGLKQPERVLVDPAWKGLRDRPELLALRAQHSLIRAAEARTSIAPKASQESARPKVSPSAAPATGTTTKPGEQLESRVESDSTPAPLEVVDPLLSSDEPTGKP